MKATLYVEQALRELDALGKALALIGRPELSTAINRDIAAPLRAAIVEMRP